MVRLCNDLESEEMTCESNDLEEKDTLKDSRGGRKQVSTSGSFKKQTPGVLEAI